MSSLIGQSLGRYQILEQLGEGGMATVYKAKDTLLDRFVAIKVIRTDQFAPSMLDEMRKRFEREAKALAKLSHPNIVHVHDYGEFEGAPYLVMEYLSSGTLKDAPAGPIPWQRALQILLPIAHALAYAHEHGVIHRDIKPANILLTENGLPMLSDFGIAKLLGSNDGGTLTTAGMSIGTPQYMAPEQWTGQSGPQSDIYSLGVVLYELVTGRKPFTADTPAGVMLKQVNEPLPSPRQFAPDLPEGLEAVLVKALARDPAGRYESMNEFAAALEALPSAMKLEVGPGGETLVASGGKRQVAAMVNQAAPGGPQTPGSPIPGVPMPPAAPPKTGTRWGRWIPIGAVVLLLCIGGVFGASALIRGLTGRNIPAVAAASITPTAMPVSDPAATASIPAAPTGTQSGSLPAPTPATEIKVLWDISHGPRPSQDGSLYTPDGMYKDLTQAMAKQKVVISAGDLTNLNSYDILVISAASASKNAYSSAEAGQIEQFVRVSGHGLLLLSDIPGFENLADPVGRRFSIGFGEATTDSPATLTTQAFFSGVNSIQFFFSGGGFEVTAPAQTAAKDKSGNAVIAFCACDAGRVLAVGDSNLWDNRGLGQADNQAFAVNSFLWLAKAIP